MASGMGEATERQQFAEHVREALAHLYDHSYLQAHPLAALLGAGPGAESTGRTLHRLLVEAIQRMQPPAELSAESSSWRQYRYLQLRYVQAKSAAQVAQELGISERQSQRDQREVVDELASTLWQDYVEGALHGHAAPADAAAGEATDPLQAPSWPVESDSLDREVAKIGGTPGEQPVRVSEVVQGVLATVARVAADRQVILLTRVPEDLPLAAVSRSALRQALLGFLMYGIGCPARRVELVADGAPRRVRLRVRIEAAALPSTKERPPEEWIADGRLAVSRRLIELQGGSVQTGLQANLISIDVELPAAVPATIMLIDDNPDVLRLFERYLCGAVSRILQVRTAQEAVQLARTSHPDVITLDVMMPSQDGWEILQILKNDEETQRIPVVVCSVLRERELALSLGATDFLAKPITQQALLGAVQRCLSG